MPFKTAILSFGGDEGDRTPYLLNAIQALSQVSYTPVLSEKSGFKSALSSSARDSIPHLFHICKHKFHFFAIFLFFALAPARFAYSELAVDAVLYHIERDDVAAALGNDYVCELLARLDVHFVHRLDGVEVLVDD